MTSFEDFIKELEEEAEREGPEAVSELEALRASYRQRAQALTELTRLSQELGQYG